MLHLYNNVLKIEFKYFGVSVSLYLLLTGIPILPSLEMKPKLYNCIIIVELFLRLVKWVL